MVPLISVIIALFAAYMTHRFTLREQQKQFRDQRRDNERQAQVDQNMKLQNLIVMLDSMKAALDNVTAGVEPPSIAVTSLIDLGSKCELGDVLSDLVRAEVAYDSARQRWKPGDASISAEMADLVRNVKEALIPVRAVAQSTLDNGRDRLDQLDLSSSKI